MMDSFRRLILPDFFRIGVNGRRHFGRRPVNYTTGELLIFGTNSSGAPSDAR